MPVGITLLEDWAVLPFRWEIQILLMVAASSFVVECPSSVELPARHTRQEGKTGLTCSANSQAAAANTSQQLSCIVPYLFYMCGDPYPSKPVHTFMTAMHGKNLLYRKGPQCGSIAKYEYASNTSHPSRLPTLHTTVLNPRTASSDIKMQLPTAVTVPDFHLTARETCYQLGNSRWMHTTDMGLQINCCFSHAPKLHKQDIALALYCTHLVQTLLNLQVRRHIDCRQVQMLASEWAASEHTWTRSSLCWRVKRQLI